MAREVSVIGLDIGTRRLKAAAERREPEPAILVAAAASGGPPDSSGDEGYAAAAGNGDRCAGRERWRGEASESNNASSIHVELAKGRIWIEGQVDRAALRMILELLSR